MNGYTDKKDGWMDRQTDRGLLEINSLIYKDRGIYNIYRHKSKIRLFHWDITSVSSQFKVILNYM